MSNLNEINKRPQGAEENDTKYKGIDLFFGEKEAKFFTNAGREMTEAILKESFILYRIDLEKTKVHKLYKEAKRKVWKPEIQIYARIIVEAAPPSYHVPGGIVKKGFGKLKADIYIDQLEELGLIERKTDNIIIIDVRMGDYINFKGEYYKIIDDGFSNVNNEHAWAGDRRFAITIEAMEIDEDEFKAR